MTSLVWTCEVCSRPVRDGTGYLTVGYAALGEYRRAERAWEEAHPPSDDGFRVLNLSEYATYPARVRWQALHRRCDPNTGAVDYWIGIERIRTPAQLLHWTAHLMGKQWIGCTDWPHVLRTAAKTVDPLTGAEAAS